jgi:RNA polymerase sigma-70 factor (ECF subfamily)
VAARDAVLSALRSLSPRQRACVVLRYYEDLPIAGIARAPGVEEGTVKRYLSEATALMAGHLSGHGSGKRLMGCAVVTWRATAGRYTVMAR